MNDESAHIYGELSDWPSKRGMARLLKKAGFRVSVGNYSVRLEDCEHFIFQHYGGDLGDPVIDADANSAADLIRDARRVSKAFADVGIRHRFEIYDWQDRMIDYLHFDWPLEDT